MLSTGCTWGQRTCGAAGNVLTVCTTQSIQQPTHSPIPICLPADRGKRAERENVLRGYVFSSTPGCCAFASKGAMSFVDVRGLLACLPAGTRTSRALMRARVGLQQARQTARLMYGMLVRREQQRQRQRQRQLRLLNPHQRRTEPSGESVGID